MLRFVGTLARIALGLTLASLAAGLVTVLFVNIDVLSGPLAGLPKTLSETGDLVLLAATHIAIFSAVFVFLTAAIGEWFSIRALAFYLLAGVTIGLLGFIAQYASEVAGQPTILNTYAIKTFLTVGFCGGFVYWLTAGRFAGQVVEPSPLPIETSPANAGTSSSSQDGDTTEVVITKPSVSTERPRWRMPVLERLKFAPRDAQTVPGQRRPSSFPETPKSSGDE